MSDCSNIIRVGIGAAQALCRKPGSNKVSFFFPTAKIGAEAPESGGVELWILATGGERTVRFFTSSKCWCLLVHHWQEETQTMERPSLLMHQERAHFFQWDGWVIAFWGGKQAKQHPTVHTVVAVALSFITRHCLLVQGFIFFPIFCALSLF